MSFIARKIPSVATRFLWAKPTLSKILRMSVRGLKVLCDGCGQENTYVADDLMRLQMQVATNFKAHPLFG